VEAHPATGGTRVEAGTAAERTGMDTGSEAGREKKVEDIDIQGIGRPTNGNRTRFPRIILRPPGGGDHAKKG
jgi:hypothetical protein